MSRTNEFDHSGQLKKIRTCEFDHCGQRRLSENGMISSTLADRDDHYYPWFCSELCCNMKKHQIGIGPMSHTLYFHALDKVYKSKPVIVQEDEPVGFDQQFDQQLDPQLDVLFD